MQLWWVGSVKAGSGRDPRQIFLGRGHSDSLVRGPFQRSTEPQRLTIRWIAALKFTNEMRINYQARFSIIHLNAMR